MYNFHNMNHQFKEDIDFMAKEIRAQARNMKVDTFLAYLYTSDVINKYLDMVLADKTVSRAGFNILHKLILNDGTMTPTEISKKTFRSKYSVTSAIDTLEKQGLVERLPIGEDRRNRKINITRKGLDTIDRATIDSRERISQDIFHTIDGEGLEELNNILKDIRKHVLGLMDKLRQSQET